MTRVGIVGLGFMGKMHFRCYSGLQNVQIVAICDVDQSKFEGSGAAGGNIEGAEAPLDFSGIGQYRELDLMLAETNLDALSVTLPTYLHTGATVAALEAGVNVLCEKPMALTVPECQQMITAAGRTGKLLQVGHCIRFWPEYATTKELIESAKYGKMLAEL